MIAFLLKFKPYFICLIFSILFSSCYQEYKIKFFSLKKKGEKGIEIKAVYGKMDLLNIYEWDINDVDTIIEGVIFLKKGAKKTWYVDQNRYYYYLAFNKADEIFMTDSTNNRDSEYLRDSLSKLLPPTNKKFKKINLLTDEEVLFRKVEGNLIYEEDIEGPLITIKKIIKPNHCYEFIWGGGKDRWYKQMSYTDQLFLKTNGGKEISYWKRIISTAYSDKRR